MPVVRPSCTFVTASVAKVVAPCFQVSEFTVPIVLRPLVTLVPFEYATDASANSFAVPAVS